MRAPPLFPLLLLAVAVGFGAVVYAVERRRRRSGRAWVFVLRAEPWQADDPVPQPVAADIEAERAYRELVQRARGQAAGGQPTP